MSRVFSSAEVLSRVFLSRVFWEYFRFIPGILELSRVFWLVPGILILSRVFLSRVFLKGRGNYGPAITKP